MRTVSHGLPRTRPRVSLLGAVVCLALSGCGAPHVRTVGLLPAPIFAPRAAAAPEITAHLHALDAPTVSSLFGRSFARTTCVWAVTLTNATTETVTVPESAVLSRAALSPLGMVPFAIEQMVLTGQQSQSILGRATAAYTDANQAALVLMASKVIVASGAVLTGVAVASAVAPILFRDLQGYGPQTVSSFERLNWSAPVTLVPGSSATVYVYSRNRAADVDLTLTLSSAPQQSRVAR